MFHGEIKTTNHLKPINCCIPEPREDDNEFIQINILEQI